MPTGYTHKIYENGQSFNDFVMDCARAFGACVSMRDEPASTPIPNEFVPSDYNLKRMHECINDLINLRNADKNAYNMRKHVEAITRHNDTITKYRNLRARYEKMLDEVLKWTPPSPDHTQLQDFMVRQLNDSIDFDCSERYLKPPVEGTDYYNKEIEQLQLDISYHKKEYDEEVVRVSKRNEWIKQLRNSLS